MWNWVPTACKDVIRETTAFVQAETAVTSIEYALIAALIAIAIVGSVTNAGSGLWLCTIW